MASCAVTIDAFVAADGEIVVSEKYKTLMADSLGEGSIYERVKDTYFELFKDLNISESEKLQLVAANISNLAASISTQAMATAISWAKEERDGTYQLAQVKAQTELSLAQYELTAEQICKTTGESAMITAQTLEIEASTIRNDAMNASQVKASDAANYSALADAYRKSGVVNISNDADGVLKGTSGDLNGLTNQQQSFSERQEISFNDSLRSHAANSSSQLMGQLLSAEIPITETSSAYLLWKTAMEYLTTDH